MATIDPTITRIDTFADQAHVIAWETLTTTDDTGAAIEMPGSADRSIQFNGAFSVGGTIVLEGSNDGTNYVTLTDPQGNAISKTADGIEAVQELTRYVRPRVTAGDGSTSLNAYLLVKRG